RFHGPTRLRFKLFCRSSIILESVAWLTIAMLDGTEQQANENSFEHEHYQKAQRRKAQHCSRIEMDHGFHHAHENRNCKQAHHKSSDHHCDEVSVTFRVTPAGSDVWWFVAAVSSTQLGAAIIAVR